MARHRAQTPTHSLTDRPGPTRIAAAAFAAIALLLGLTVSPAVAESASTNGAAPAASQQACDSMTQSAWYVRNPSNEVSLVTPWESEAKKAQQGAFTDARGEQFKVAVQAGHGLLPVHRLYNASTNDFFLTTNQYEVRSATERAGYTDSGVSFYASSTPSDCTIPVNRWLKGNKHRHAAAGSAIDNEARQNGWHLEGVSFYAAPLQKQEAPKPDPAPVPAPNPDPAPRPGGTFTIAIYPDTQQEVFAPDTRFIDRSKWIVANKDKLNVKYALHGGDVVNWGANDEPQMQIASDAMKPLEDAGIPYQLSIGNHDTAAVCQGGSGCPGVDVRQAVRDTKVFNKYFPVSRFPGMVTYEPNKVDNSYRTFSAGGAEWLALNLELWPRDGAIEWARQVVASHPRHNVIVQTHNYLNGDGSIGQSKEYGTNSPQVVWDRLISQYPNIRFTLSGHTGWLATGQHKGVHGNTISSMLTTLHSNDDNPVRLLEINTNNNTASTRVYGPKLNKTYPGSASWSDLNYVR